MVRRLMVEARKFLRVQKCIAGVEERLTLVLAGAEEKENMYWGGRGSSWWEWARDPLKR